MRHLSPLFLSFSCLPFAGGVPFRACPPPPCTASWTPGVIDYTGGGSSLHPVDASGAPWVLPFPFQHLHRSHRHSCSLAAVVEVHPCEIDFRYQFNDASVSEERSYLQAGKVADALLLPRAEPF